MTTINISLPPAPLRLRAVTQSWPRRALLCGLLLLLALPFAASGQVTTVQDELDTPASGGLGISLREAIRDAAPGATITFAPSLSGLTITLTGGELLINKNLTIDASALPDGITVSGSNASAVFNISSGTVTLDSLTITGGNSSANGGGISNSGTLTVRRCTISGNSSDIHGGGIANALSAVLTAINCTITNNSGSIGGGIFATSAATVVLSHTTITGNSATVRGGGIRFFTGTAMISNTIIAGNTAGTFSDINKDGGIVITRSGANLIGDNSSVTTEFPVGNANGNGDIVGVAPLLAPLGDYGGPTPTRPLLAGSPGIDAGGATSSESTDQRGRPRVLNGALDIGAVEGPIVITANLNNSGAGSLRQAILDVPSSGSIFFSAGLSGGTVTLGGTELLINKNLTIDASPLADGITISGNETSRVFGVGGVTVTLKGINITKGKTTGRGGAIQNSGTLTISHSAIYGNTAGDIGGAISNNGPLTILNSTLTGNTSSNVGGAIFTFTTLNLTSCTFSRNTGTFGGGIRSQNAAVMIKNTIIAGNFGNPSHADYSQLGGTITSQGGNLIGDRGLVSAFPLGSPNVNGDLVGTLGAEIDPLLAPLAYYGGPTQTMPPLLGSPAIDPAGSTTMLTGDQRGFARVVGSSVDIGAAEAGEVVTVTSAATLNTAIQDTTPDRRIIFNASLDGQTLNLASELTVPTGKSLMIDSSTLSQGITLNAAANSRVMLISSGSSVTMRGMGVTGGNHPANGGGLEVSGNVVLLDSTVFGNTAGNVGGGMWITSGGIGFARNCTFANNTGVGNGGGGFWVSGEMTLEHGTVANNTTPDPIFAGGIGIQGPPANLTLINSIVAQNTSNSSAPDLSLSSGTITTLGVNLIGDLNGSTLNAGPNVLTGDPLLTTLGAYGGPTKTMYPLPGSPAIDAGGATTLATDQRGLARVVGGTPDIGAVETGNAISGVTLSIVSFDGDTVDGIDTNGISLREAIILSDPGATITFDASLDGQSITLGGSQLLIDKDLTIDASALPSGVTISGNNLSRVLQIAPGNDVTLRGLTVSGGNDSGILNLGTLSVLSCTISNNSDPSVGGGIYSQSASLVIRDSTIFKNTSAVVGGILVTGGGSLLMENSTVTGNTSTTRAGGGLWVEGAAVATIRNSTIAGNEIGTVSGGLPAESGAGLFVQSVSSVTLENTIVANNIAEARAGGANVPSDIQGSFTTVGVNLVEVHAPGSGSITGPAPLAIDPLLGPFGDYGGPTQTLPPLPGSPVIDAAGAIDPGGTDQRGAPRFSSGALDIGAVEYLVAVVTTAADEDNIDPGTGLSLREAIAEPFVNMITFDAGLGGQTIVLGGTELLINKSLTIDASALTAGLTVSGNNASRVFEIAAGSFVTLRSLNITGGNSASYGGGLLVGGSVVLLDSTVSGNTADNVGGGMGIESGGVGLARNCTFTDNTASINGGGGIWANGQLTLEHATVANNSTSSFNYSGGVVVQGGPLTVTNSIVAQNTTNSSSPDLRWISGAITALGVNLIGDLTGSTLSVGPSVITGDPRLAPLGDYGGPTRTMQPLAGSPVVDAGGASSLSTDQRGLARPIGAANDIGAVEVQSTSVVVQNAALTLRPTLTWSVPEATSMELFLGADAGSLASLGNRTSPYTPGSPLDLNITYFWRVDATIGGEAVPGVVHSFTTRAPNLVVDTVVDENDGVLTGGISLRDAIAEAVTAVPPESITFAPGLDGLPITLGGTQLLINKDLTIDASTLPSGITISGDDASRVFEIAAGATVTMKYVTIKEGSSSVGGGIFSNGALNLENSTVSNNQSTVFGGGIASGGDLTVSNCTIANNFAGFGGGLWLDGPTQLVHATIANNDGNPMNLGVNLGTAAIENSVIAESAQPSGVPNLIGAQKMSFSGVNLISSGVSPGPTVVVGDPVLAPLADNGGPTETMMLLPGSPAIDAGGATSLLADQRGFERVLGSGPDIGAYEASAGSYNAAGLTLFATMDPALTSSGVVFEISSDPDFRPAVSTLAGSGAIGAQNGPRATAEFSFPLGVAQDAAGNIFIADTANNRIRMMTPEGVVSTIAGTGESSFIDNPGLSATFRLPGGIAVGPDSNLYVADTFNHCIRKLLRPVVAGQQWTVTTLAGTEIAGFEEGRGTGARFNQPVGLAIDGDGNLYVADTKNHRIRKVTAAGQVSTYAGFGFVGSVNGFRQDARFNEPFGLALDSSANLFITDRHNHLVRRIDAASGQVSTVAGQAAAPGFVNGNGSAARFNQPVGIAIDDLDNLYVTEDANHAIRKVTPGGTVSTVAGTGTSGFLNGSDEVARFHCPAGLLVDLKGDLLVADAQNHVVRRIIVNPVTVNAGVAGGGGTVNAMLDTEALGLDPNQTYYFRWRSLLNDSTQDLGQSFFLVEAPTVVTEPASNLTSTTARLNATVNPNNSPTEVRFEYSTDPNLAGPLRVGPLVSASLSSPRGTAVDGSGHIYVADRAAHRILVFDEAGQSSGSFGAGTDGFAEGPGAGALFDHPADVALNGNFLYVADEFNHRIRRIDLATGAVSTFAGSGIAGHADGADTEARFQFPTGLAFDSLGNLFVADSKNHRIRKITPAGDVTTVAGTGVAGSADGAAGTAQFNTPLAVAVSRTDKLYVSDTGNHRIRAVTAGNSLITIAGGTQGFLDANGSAAQFSSPTGIVVDAAGVVFVTDRDNHRIRRISTGGEVSTLAGSGVNGLTNSPVGELHPATATEFGFPVAITADSAGDLYVSEEGNATIRKITHDLLPTVTVTPDATGAGDQLVSADPPEPLLPGGTYYFRAIGTNGRNDPAQGEILSFVTPESEIVVHNGASTAAPVVNPGQTVRFGATPFNTPVARTFTIQNIGNFELEIADITLVAPASGAFALSGNTWPTVVPAGGSATFDVTLESGIANAYTDQVIITSSDLDEDTITFAVSGEVLAPPVLSNVADSEVTALDVTFSASVNPSGSATKLAFEFSRFQDFAGALEVLSKAGAEQGFANGCGAGAKFDTPSDVVVDRFGNVYVADTLNHRIRKITADGDCNVLAGSGTPGFADGSTIAAQFNAPEGLAIDPAGNLYVADTLNHRIRRITPLGVVTTVAGTGSANFTDGVVGAARFNLPTGITLDANRNIYIADSGNNRIRKIDTAGEVSTLAGPAEFNSPQDVAVDASGNVFVADLGNDRIRKVTPTGFIATLPGAGSQFSGPAGVAVDSAGNVYVADRDGHRIVRINPASQITVLAGLLNQPGGNDGSGTDARFDNPAGLTVSSAGTIYVADRNNHRIRQINLAARTVVAATGLNGTASLPVEVDISGLEPNTLYYYRAIASNGGGTAFSPSSAPYPTFTTLDNAAALTGLTVNGNPVAGFDPCIYSYPLVMAGGAPALIITATAQSEAATIQVLEDSVYCCELQSGVPSDPLPLQPGPNRFRVAVLSADGTAARTYTIDVTRPPAPFAQWQTANFGSDASNPAIAGPLADPSGYGVNNLQKYAFGLDPNLNSQDGLPIPGQGLGVLTLEYPKIFAATDLTYTVQWSTDLVTWSTVDVTEQILTDDGTTQQILATVPMGTGSRKFVRLALTLQP